MTGRVETFRSAVVARIKTIAPALRSAETQFGRFDLDELERNVIRCPAVRVSVLKVTLKDLPAGSISAVLDCAAFVVTDGSDRDDTAWTLAEAIATQLHSGQLWGLTRLGAPEKPSIEPVVSGSLKQRGVAVMAVLWSQELRHLGDNIFDEAGVLLQELYVNGEEIDLSEGGDHA
ncbi:hypothetical protein P7F60_06255 [Rhizobium sp. YJ-22]|uniref:hypothetical protein n=1 Tax=Rhizobium sp. YJ-22 TaxID=3037556 RepID=UPI0024129A5B|nr:hypothetical protein [Rhizobium sp. YJ-22]MDG3575978.1 hypothetical protein [Rhizobium sp. YJ-22]